ncbi:hypothetical protein VNO77_20170 [Canavalia gladiata]|uniref:Uncharacterized protein n=1 Tax=Canavalia gladiata TaxID=3824 RepID=A0AAN9QL28_CANGL
MCKERSSRRLNLLFVFYRQFVTLVHKILFNLVLAQLVNQVCIGVKTNGSPSYVSWGADAKETGALGSTTIEVRSGQVSHRLTFQAGARTEIVQYTPSKGQSWNQFPK